MPSPAGRHHPRPEKRRRSGWWGLRPVGSFSEFLTCDVVASDSPEGEDAKAREKLLAQISPFVA